MECCQEIKRCDGNEVAEQVRNVQPVIALPNTIILYILSRCDYRSLLKAMAIDEVWKDCGEYTLQKESYWRNLCRNDIIKNNLVQYLSKEGDDELVYKRIYLKFFDWQEMKKCSKCTNELNVHKPEPCPAHPVTIAHRRGILKRELKHAPLRVSGRKIEYWIYKNVTVKLSNFGKQQKFLIFSMDLSENIFYSVVVNELIPSHISTFYFYGNVLILGLQNGTVLVYFVDSWHEFSLTNYVMKCVGIRGRIRNIALKERGMKRTIAVEAARRVYTFTWVSNHNC